MTAREDFADAYNEYVAEKLAAHGQSAIAGIYREADNLEGIGRDLGAVIVKYKLNPDDAEHMIEAQSFISPDERALVACAVAVALEEVK